MLRLLIFFMLIPLSELHAQPKRPWYVEKMLASCTGPGAELDEGPQVFAVHGPLYAASVPIQLGDGLAVIAYGDRKNKAGLTERFYRAVFIGNYRAFPSSLDEVVTATSSIAEITPIASTFIKVSSGAVTDYFVHHFDGWYVLSSFNRSGLRQYRNHIFARYGLRFKSADLREYFSQFPWYQPRYDNVDNMLTDEEKALIKVIQAAEAKATE